MLIKRPSRSGYVAWWQLLIAGHFEVVNKPEHLSLQKAMTFARLVVSQPGNKNRINWNLYPLNCTICLRFTAAFLEHKCSNKPKTFLIGVCIQTAGSVLARKTFNSQKTFFQLFTTRR